MRIVQALGTLGTILLIAIAGCGDDGESGSTGPDGDVDVSGEWTYSSTVEASGGDEPCSHSGVTLVLVPGGASSASGGFITCGADSGPFGEFAVSDLDVDGTTVVFSIGEFVHDGTVIGNSMGGDITGDIGDQSLSGEWSAVKQ